MSQHSNKIKKINSAADCCPEFHPEKWDKKIFNWKKKKFVKETIPAFFHIPFPPMIGKKITKMMNLIDKAKQNEKNLEETLVLFADPTPFKSEIYISVKGEVPGANNSELSGKFIAKVFDGGYNDIPKFAKIMRRYLLENFQIETVKNEDFFVHYAYCPNCQKKYGHNYMILFARTG